MFQKIANAAALLSLVLITGTLGSTYFGYKYVTSPHGQTKIKNALLGDLKKVLPTAIGNQMPKTTGAQIKLK
jgi:hypothetical protein